MSKQLLDQLERRVEAILFASGDPVDARKISEILEIEIAAVHQLVARIKERYTQQNSPILIVSLDSSYQMCTKAEFRQDIQSALELRRTASLSQAALEALAVIAYNQPVTRAFVEEVRGVDCSSLIRSLGEKDLIEETGRMNIPGRPIIYKTTPTFLLSFGLNSLEQLPLLPENDEDETGEPQVEGQIRFNEEEAAAQLLVHPKEA